MTEQLSKRIKLTLEPYVDRIPENILENGQLIYSEDFSIQDRLSRNIDRIWTERQDFKNITQENLRSATSTDVKETERPTIPAGQSASSDVQKMRETLFSKITIAKSEIDVTLDVITILLSQSRGLNLPQTTPPILSPGVLVSSYIQKPKFTQRALIETAKLTIGRKRAQFARSSNLLLNSAASLSKVVEREREFWAEMIELRRHNWIIQARAGGGPPGQPAGPGKSFWIQYGFSDVGSKFTDPSHAEVIRNLSTQIEDSTTISPSISLALPHSQKRYVKIRILEIGVDARKVATEADLSDDELVGEDREENDIQHELLDAQSTIFEAELFGEIQREARLMTSRAGITDNEIIIPIDEHYELALEYIDAPLTSPSQSELSTPASSTSHPIGNGGIQINTLESPGSSLFSAGELTTATRTLLHLLLLRQHRFNQALRLERMFNSSKPGRLPLSSVFLSTSTGAAPSQTNSAPAAGATTVQQQQQAPPQIQPPPPPILAPTVNLLRFWCMVSKVLAAANILVAPLCSAGGLKMRVQIGGVPDITFAARQLGREGEVGLVLAVGMVRGPALRFTLRAPTTILAHLSQTAITVSSISQFRQLLDRELNLLILKIVCEEVSGIVVGPNDTEGGRRRWTVDEVDEKGWGVIWWRIGRKEGKEEGIWRTVAIVPSRPNSTTFTISFTIPGDAKYKLREIKSTFILESSQKDEPSADVDIPVVDLRIRARFLVRDLVAAGKGERKLDIKV